MDLGNRQQHYENCTRIIKEYETVSKCAKLTLFELVEATKCFEDLLELGPAFEPQAFGMVNGCPTLKVRAWNVDRLMVDAFITQRIHQLGIEYTKEQVLKKWKDVAKRAAQECQGTRPLTHSDYVLLSLAEFYESLAAKYGAFYELNRNPRSPKDFERMVELFHQAVKHAKKANKWRNKASEPTDEQHVNYLSFYYHATLARASLLRGDTISGRTELNLAISHADQFDERDLFSGHYYSSLGDLKSEHYFISAIEKLKGKPADKAIREAASEMGTWYQESSVFQGKGRYWLFYVRKLTLDALACMAKDDSDLESARDIKSELSQLVEEQQTSLGGASRELRAIVDDSWNATRRGQISWDRVRNSLLQIFPLDAFPPYQPLLIGPEIVEQQWPPFYSEWLGARRSVDRVEYVLLSYLRHVCEYLQGLCLEEKTVKEAISGSSAPGSLPANCRARLWKDIEDTLEYLFTTLGSERKDFLSDPVNELLEGLNDYSKKYAAANARTSSLDKMTQDVGSLIKRTAKHLFPQAVKVTEISAAHGNRRLCVVDRHWNKTRVESALRVLYHKDTQLLKLDRSGASKLDGADVGRWYFMKPSFKWHNLNEWYLEQHELLWFYPASSFGIPRLGFKLFYEGDTEEKALPKLLEALLPCWRAFDIEFRNCGGKAGIRDAVLEVMKDVKRLASVAIIADLDEEGDPCNAKLKKLKRTYPAVSLTFVTPDFEGCDPESLAQAINGLEASLRGDLTFSADMISEAINDESTRKTQGGTLPKIEKYWRKKGGPFLKLKDSATKVKLAEPLAEQMISRGIPKDIRDALSSTLNRAMGCAVEPEQRQQSSIYPALSSNRR